MPLVPENCFTISINCIKLPNQSLIPFKTVHHGDFARLLGEAILIPNRGDNAILRTIVIYAPEMGIVLKNVGLTVGALGHQDGLSRI